MRMENDQSSPAGTGDGLSVVSMTSALGVGVAFVIIVGGCVSQATHQQVLDELRKVKQEAAQQAVEDEKRFNEALRENQRIAAKLEELQAGKVDVRQLRDRLTITMVDRVLFESGSDRITTEGMGVLNKVGAALKEVRNRQIRVSGHTDNVQIGPSLKSQFKTNWELSTARATSVVRYLVDHAALDPHLLTAVGHAYTQPVAANDTEEGRARNRRIEIGLYPKDLTSIVRELENME